MVWLKFAGKVNEDGFIVTGMYLLDHFWKGVAGVLQSSIIPFRADVFEVPAGSTKLTRAWRSVQDSVFVGQVLFVCAVPAQVWKVEELHGAGLSDWFQCWIPLD